MQIGFTINRFKSLFLDRALLEGRIDKTTFKVMSRFGAYVRQAARRSIRNPRGKGKPRPGKPPYNRTGLLKGHIYFGWEDTTQAVVVGAALLSGGRRTPNTIPQILEDGGAAPHRKFKGRVVTWKAFPYMKPALAGELPKLPGMWRDAL